MTVRQRKEAGGKGSEGKARDAGDKDKKRGGGPFPGRFNPKFGGHGRRPESTANGTWMDHSTWSRIIMIVGMMVVAYSFSGKNGLRGNGRTVMAKFAQDIDEKVYMNSLCAPSFKKEIKDLGNEACMPKKCGRFITDGVVTSDEAHDLLDLAKKGLGKGGSSGGASILDLHSGALSQGEQFVNLYKVHPDLFKRSDFDVYRKVQQKVKSAVASHFDIDPSSLHLTHPTFFSRLTARDPATPHDEYWHLHVDKETYPTFHYTSLLYLTDWSGDFQGGEFVFVDGHDGLNRTVQPKLGRVSAFTSGVENKHLVERVTGGVRYALTMGFTCDRDKAIAEPGSQLGE